MGRKKANHVHEYVTYSLETDTSKCMVEGCATIIKGNHSSNLLKHFCIHHPNVSREIIEKNQKAHKDKVVSPFIQALPVVSKKNRNYTIVRQACIDLVKEYPVSLISSAAFQSILKLITLRSDERAMITSQNIELINQRGENCDKENEDDAESSTIQETPHKRKIKGEDVQCTCNADDDDEGTPHRADCAAFDHQEFYTVQQDESNDGEAAAGSSVTSHEDVEEVYLDVDFLQKSASQPPKKRLKTAFLSDPITSQKMDLEVDDGGQIEKSLDRFGLYIASLMKPLPKYKRVKFQSQIVQRLLQEQASSAA